MLQSSVVVGFGLLAVFSLLLVAWLWVGKSWLREWLRGNAGLLLIAFAVLLGFAVVDFSSYEQARPGVPIATVTMYELEPQLFELEVVMADGAPHRYEIRGEQWQMDFRIFKWWGPMSAPDALPAYRPEALSGRFFSLEQERSFRRKSYSLAESGAVDVWSFFESAGLWLRADMWHLRFMPLVNAAVFAIDLTPDGLKGRPMNDIAIKAQKGDW